MTVRYSTNWMGPVASWWYHDRGLTGSDSWAGGRIDICGLDNVRYYNGRHEYGLPIMDGDSWRRLSEWLNDYSSDTLMSFEELMAEFEQETQHTIRWAHDEWEM